MIMDEIAQKPAIRQGRVVPRATARVERDAESHAEGIFYDYEDYDGFLDGRGRAIDVINEYTDLVAKGKSDDLSRNPGNDNNGVCYMANMGCNGIMDSDTCFNYCWGNCEACDRYVPDRRKDNE